MFANSRGDFFSGSLNEAIDGAANHYQVVHGENSGKTPVVNHMSDNINSCGEGSHKKFNGTISCVVMDIKSKETINLNSITSTKKEIAPFPPLVLASLDSEPTYNDTLYESEFELLPSSFRPDFMIDLLMKSNVPLEQRPRQVPRPGVNQTLSQLETVTTPKCLVGMRLIEATPIQTNRLYDTHDQQTSDDYLNRLRGFSRLADNVYHPLCLTGDQGYLQRMVRSSSRHSDHQEYFVIKLGGFHIIQNAHACINRIYPSILYIPKMLGQSHVADGKNHNSCRAYSETLTILLCKHPDRELLLKNPMLRDLFRWGLLFIAIRLSSCRVKQEYQEHFSILDSIDYLYGLLDLFYEGGGHNYVRYVLREKAIEFPKIKKLIAQNYSFVNWVGINEGVPMDEGAEHKVRHYKGNMRHNHRNQFLRKHATDICREYAEIVGPITSMMDKVIEVVNQGTAVASVNSPEATELKEANERLFVMYAKPIQHELDRQRDFLNKNDDKLPPGKYLPMGLSELADHSNSVQHFNEMIQTTFNNNAQRSLATTIPKTFMGARRYQKGVSPQLIRDIEQYAISKKDPDLKIASLDIYAPAIETKDHTFIISPTDSWLSEQAENWRPNELVSCLVEFMIGVGIKIKANIDVEYQITAGESEEEAFLAATLEIFAKNWPTRALSVIRKRPVHRPTLQETTFLVRRILYGLFKDRYDFPDDEPRELIKRIPRCSCKTKDRSNNMLCSTLRCKCANRRNDPGCNVLCSCLAKEGDCFRVESPDELEQSIHNLSIEESFPQSPRRRRRIDSSTPECSVSSKSSRESDEDSLEIIDLLEAQQAPVFYSSRRLTAQQRQRLAPDTQMKITETSAGDHVIDFNGFGTLGLGDCFRLQHACSKFCDLFLF